MQTIKFALLAFILSFSTLSNAESHYPTMPTFSHTESSQWLNSKPLTWEALQGKVVLLDIWTFGCWNCYRSFPWLNALEEEYEDKGLQVIGIHTPEFEHEKDRDAVIEKMKTFNIKHPVMLDNDFSYWKKLGNRYWPTFYLVDKQGRLRGYYIGETHAGDKNAKAIEKQVKQLLKENNTENKKPDA
jgi:thiol-disulfide isomerase/thioredoxin